MRNINVVILEHQKEKLEQVQEDLGEAREFDWETDEGPTALGNAQVALVNAVASLESALTLARRQIAREAPGQEV